MRQHASPAVDVLGGKPQAAQNVAGESPRHAPQPVAAAPRPVPPITNPSIVPLPDSSNSAFPDMENNPPTTLSETRPHFEDVVSQDVLAEESISGFARSLPSSLNEDCSSSAEMQKLSSPLCPLTSQIGSTVQELQYGSQTVKEKNLSNSQTNQFQANQESPGLVAVARTKGKQSITLEYKPETETNMELSGKKHTGENILPQSQSQICFTVSPSSVPQTSIGLNIQNPTKQGISEQSGRQQGSHKPPSGPAEPSESHQDAKSSLPHSSVDNAEIKQVDFSKTQPKTVSNDARESHTANSLGSVEALNVVKDPVVSSLRETQPHSSEICEAQKAGASHPGLYSSRKGSPVSICSPLEVEQVSSDTREEQTNTTTTSSELTVLPEFSSLQESPSKPASEPPLFDTSLVVSLQAEEVSKAETSHTSDQVSAPEASLIAEIVHSGNAQEIVVVREEAHIGGEWSNVHLNQSYLLQREDGSVCEAAIVNELSTGEPKLYEESVQGGMELYSQAVEVYEFCGLVEEVAEETVCASGSAQIPHSPGYEVNLFNALLENSDGCALKEHLEPSIHAVNQSDTIIISQQPLASSSDNNSHNLSVQKAGVTAVGQRLVLDSNQAVEVAHSSEVCLVQVAAVTSESFTVEQTDTCTHSEAHCSQVDKAGSDLREQSNSAVIQTFSPKQGAETAVGSVSLISPLVTVTGEGVGIQSVAVSVPLSSVENHPSLVQTQGFTVVSATEPEVCASSGERTKGAPSRALENVVVPTKTKSETLSLSSGVIDPKFLLFKPGETPVLKHPPSRLEQVSLQKSLDGKLANAHSSWSDAVSEECLPPAVSAADSLSTSVALSSQKDQAPGSVSKTSEAAAPVKVQQPALSSITSLLHEQTESVTRTASTSKFEALTLTKTSASEAERVSTSVALPTDATPPITPDSPEMLAASEEREGTVMVSADPDNPVDHPDYTEDEGEDMEQDKAEGETEVHEDTSGQVSSPEEDSDDEPDADEGESMAPNSSHKVLKLKIR